MKLIHLSTSNEQEYKIFKPRLPDNWMVNNGFEDKTTKRVSFSQSIDGCLRGIGSNLTGKTLYIYEPVNMKGLKMIPNSSVSRHVPDAHITKEIWVLNDVKVKLVGEVYVIDSYEEPTYFYFGKNNEHRGESYRWKFKVKMYN